MSEPASSIGLGTSGGPGKATPLLFIWICDVSNSMLSGNKMQEMNKSIEKAITEMKKLCKNTPNLRILIRTITFSTGANWVESDFISIDSYKWKPLEATTGYKDLGYALSQVADVLKYKKDGGLMPEKRSKKPHLVLVTDGYPTDDWESGLNKLMSTFWGNHAIRMAVALGDAADDENALAVLRQFVGNVDEDDKKIIRATTLSQSDFSDIFIFSPAMALEANQKNVKNLYPDISALEIYY